MRPVPLLLITVSAWGAALSLPAVEPPVALHHDPGAMEQAALDATRAVLREDAHGARRALDRMAEGCRIVDLDDDAGLPSDVIAWDQAFHSRLNLAREMAIRGNVDETFDSLVAIQRACRGCHEKAVEHGRMAPRKHGAD